MADAHPADWYPDPAGRHQHRYWDGARWTEHVADGGTQSTDDIGASPEFGGIDVDSGKAHRPDVVRAQVATAGAAGIASGTGSGSLFEEPVLVVNQKAKLIEVVAEYAVYDQHGTRIGSVREVGQTKAKKLLRVVSNLDQFLTHSYEIRDAGGTVQLFVVRPRKVLKSTVQVNRADGSEVGKVVQRNVVGKIRFGLVDAAGAELGSINAENWRQWNFNIQDAAGGEVARITKTWEGLGKAMFTTADNYVLQIHAPLAEPLRSLVVASALSIDTALKQDSGGFT